MIVQLRPIELKEFIDTQEDIHLIDVREEWEHHYAKLENSELMPLGLFNKHAMELNPLKKIVIYCHHGIRSYQACEYLQRMGFSDLFNLDGGIDAWSKEVDNSVPLY
jgi:rhodanese-related sulfurtransferase